MDHPAGVQPRLSDFAHTNESCRSRDVARRGIAEFRRSRPLVVACARRNSCRLRLLSVVHARPRLGGGMHPAGASIMDPEQINGSFVPRPSDAVTTVEVDG